MSGFDLDVKRRRRLDFQRRRRECSPVGARTQ
jgi:hypothetical protein